MLLNEDAFFDRWQQAGDQALTILDEGCTVPPSFEVFEHGLEQVRERAKAPIDVRRYARSVADSYEQAVDAFDDTGCQHAKVAAGLTGRGSVVEACPSCDFVDGWPSIRHL